MRMTALWRKFSLFSHGPVDVPSTDNSASECGWRNADLDGPLKNSRGLSKILNAPTARTLITRLLQDCGPSAIPRSVRPVVVDAVDAVTLWARTHISKKCRKGIDPFVADGYSSTAVAFVSLVVSVQASSLHSVPNSIFGGPLHAVSSHDLGMPRQIAGATPALRNGHIDRLDMPTYASGKPSLAWPFRLLRNDRPRADALAAPVLTLHEPDFSRFRPVYDRP